MEIFIILVTGVIGLLSVWYYAKQQQASVLATERDAAANKFKSLETDFLVYKTTSQSKIAELGTRLEEELKQKIVLEEKLEQKLLLVNELSGKLAATEANEKQLRISAEEKQNSLLSLNESLVAADKKLVELQEQLVRSQANEDNAKKQLLYQQTQQKELSLRSVQEFQNIANQILEVKSQKFTDLNRDNLKNILAPLGDKLAEFKTRVEEVYNNEAKERFSLAEKVKELAQLNQQISDEAKNLTLALKGSNKTQGIWGEMILESILEKSGLTKGREYFMEHQLTDDAGKALVNDDAIKKLRPDAVVQYPGDRTVIIDAKVSLVNYIKAIESGEVSVHKAEMQSHVSSIKNHINQLSNKSYDDYAKSLDFVMMFIPNEAAYLAALQTDADLWNYAYQKRILLVSPTHLITSLKLIVDLWKRENQNVNAVAIAERGGKLYDKFVNFVSNLELVGESLSKAQLAYDNSFKQLTSGKDNLVLQANRLKDLGVKAKKDLPKSVMIFTNEADALSD